MTQHRNQNLAIQIGLSVLPQLIQDAQNLFGPNNGPSKHQAVLDGVTAVLGGATAIAAQNNPEYAPLAPPLISFFGTIIKAIVDGRKKAGIPVTAEVTTGVTTEVTSAAPASIQGQPPAAILPPVGE